MAEGQERRQGAAPEAVESGSYELIRERLAGQGRALAAKAEALNVRRLEVFGGTETRLVGTKRIRTENSCVARDTEAVGPCLLFGYNVFIGLRSETAVDDVFSLYRFEAGDGELVLEPGGGAAAAFLADPVFVRDFRELYRYYKDARLLQLRRVEGKLLAVFRTGAAPGDVRVFRWLLEPGGGVSYLDNRGERDHVFPPSHDFEWVAATRENFVTGRHPHVSIRDALFVETVGGDLTVKIENNTESGEGVYSEPVAVPDQALEDAAIEYAEVGPLIIVRVRPYREDTWRHLVFNRLTRSVQRIDAVGGSCQRLPEEHGIVFPGGYHLASGETRIFEGDYLGVEFMRRALSPNGEDVLYAFHRREEGRTVLIVYNLIRKEVLNPITCHGFSLFDDGTLVLLRADSEEPTRVHTLQVWRTPFMTTEHAARVPATGSPLEAVGNAELVRGISDCLALRRSVEGREPSRAAYEKLVREAQRVLDSYHWLPEPGFGDLAADVRTVRETAELIIDEFEKVEALRASARAAVDAAEGELRQLAAQQRRESWDTIEPYVEALARLRRERGRLASLGEMRYVDRERLDLLAAEAAGHFDALAARAVEFLRGGAALAPYTERIAVLVARAEAAAAAAELLPVRREIDELGAGLEVLAEIVGALPVEDGNVRTAILESIAEVMAGLNRARAIAGGRGRELGRREAAAEFGAQFKILEQAVTGAMSLADTPERCDEQLSRVMVGLEELEGRFGEVEEYAASLATRREEIWEAFSARRQSLVDERQARARHLADAANRVLEGIARRAAAQASADDLAAWFAADPMVLKVRDLAGRLRDLGESVRADEVLARLKATRADAQRGLRDRRELFEEGASVVRLGRHRFSVNTRPVDLTLVPAAEGLALHITGTDFHEPVRDPALEAHRPCWSQMLVSENDDVSRAEYLAAELLVEAEEGRAGRSLAQLEAAALEGEGALLALVRLAASERFDEGYERGVHDADAARILAHLVGLHRSAGLLRFAPRPRAVAGLFWGDLRDRERRDRQRARARSLSHLRALFHHSPALDGLIAEFAGEIGGFASAQGITLSSEEARASGSYLLEELAEEDDRFVTSAEADRLRLAFLEHLRTAGADRRFEDGLRALGKDLALRWELAGAWLDGYLDRGAGSQERDLAPVRDEVVALLAAVGGVSRHVTTALSAAAVDGLLGLHPRLPERRLELRLDEFLARLGAFRRERVPAFRAWQLERHRFLEGQRRRLRLEEFRPRVMSAFVRNRLIDEVYLPLIGDNLAKQIGALGEGARTDLMGLLLLVSPPGYGKTTLMEYVANRLGLVFMKINGPALGQAVTSLDPAEAPNATARREVEKINLALEMGSNVLLYIDDIQHTNPEFLQKFISLCDAQRRIEGVWEGGTRTYDLRGRRFAVCMAGNPYTESGTRFRIPDMLANRADVSNLGDVLHGRGEQFALSYVENALTSNPVLAPLAGRDLSDVFALARMAAGEDVPPDALAHAYGAAELEEVLGVLRRLLRLRGLLLEVNREYIASASQEEAYRREPRFQLQGSYRNMNKLAEKVAPAMNDEELEALIDDHYRGEAQTLTSGAEQNLLKLALIRGRATPAEAERWAEILRAFDRVQAMGGAADDPAARITGQLGLLSERLHGIGQAIASAARERPAESPGASLAAGLVPALEALREAAASLAAAGPAAVAGGREARLDLPGLDEALDRLGRQLAGLAPALAAAFEGLAARREGLSQAPDLGPQIAQLAAAIDSLAQAPRGGDTRVVQALTPGVYEMMGRMVSAIELTMLPLLRGIGRAVKGTAAESSSKLQGQMDKVLRSLDMLKDLLSSLRKIETVRLTPPPPPLPPPKT